MADKVPPSSGEDGPGGARRRRPAPTIDLKAAEVASEAPLSAESPASPEPEAQSASAPVTDHSPGAAAKPGTEPGTQPGTEETPAGDGERAAEAQEGQEGPKGPESADPYTGPRQPPPPRPPSSPPPSSSLPGDRWRMLGAGAAGGAGAALLALLVWLVWPSAEADESSVQRIAAIEAQMQRLSKQLAQRLDTQAEPLAVAEALTALEMRLDRLEAAKPQAASEPKPDPALTKRLGQFETRLQGLSEQLAAVGRRADTSAAALGALQDETRTATAGEDQTEGRIETLEKRLDAMGRDNQAAAGALEKRLDAAVRDNRAAAEDLSKRLTERTDATDRAVRRAAAAAALRTAVERNGPFEAELAAAAALAGDSATLAPLEPFATAGVPADSALGRDLSRLMPQMYDLAGAGQADGGFMGRLAANAQRLVRVRPVDEAPGGEPAAILSRVEARAAAGDIPGALAELGGLPERVRVPAKDWISRAEARQRALEAARRFATDALADIKPAG